MFILLLIVAICLGFSYYYTRFSKIGRILNKLPGPFVFPLIGNLNLCMGSPSKCQTFEFSEMGLN